MKKRNAEKYISFDSIISKKNTLIAHPELFMTYFWTSWMLNSILHVKTIHLTWSNMIYNFNLMFQRHLFLLAFGATNMSYQQIKVNTQLISWWEQERAYKNLITSSKSRLDNVYYTHFLLCASFAASISHLFQKPNK